MIFAALTEGSQKQVAEIAGEVVKEIMAGTPDAARAEPFTWVNVVGFVMVIIVFVIAAYMLARQQNTKQSETVNTLTAAIQLMNDRQDVQQGRCHDTQITCLRMATEASNRSASATDNNTRVLERVIAKLG